LKDICGVYRDPVMQKLSTSLSVEAARLLAAVNQNSRQKPMGRRWNFEDKSVGSGPTEMQSQILYPSADPLLPYI
jgi:hypothetical protein